MGTRWPFPPALDWLLAAVNAQPRAQAAAVRPPVRELQRALAQVEREIVNIMRAVARGDFASLERALAAAEERRTTLQVELARLDGHSQSAVIQLTPAALDRHLQGMTEKLRSGAKGNVREVIQQPIARILVGTDGALTIEARTGGLLGLEGNLSEVGDREDPALFAPTTPSTAGRQWKLIAAGQTIPGVGSQSVARFTRKETGALRWGVRFDSCSGPRAGRLWALGVSLV